MSRSYELHWKPNNPRGDYPHMCDYCGVPYRRSTLRRTRDQLLACEDCDEGGVDVTGLIEENQRSIPRHKPHKVWR